MKSTANIKRGAEHWTHQHAERRYGRTLTDSDARDIKRRYRAREKLASIAADYPQVHIHTVGRIGRGAAWKHLNDETAEVAQ